MVALAISACLGGCKEHPSANGPDSLPRPRSCMPRPFPPRRWPPIPSTVRFGRKRPGLRLVSPLNDTRSTPPTQVACAYDAANLYVAFVCAIGDPYPGMINGLPWGTRLGRAMDRYRIGWCGDCHWRHPAPQHAVGCEMFRIIVTSQGKAFAYWYRCAAPPKPKDDGSPDLPTP